MLYFAHFILKMVRTEKGSLVHPLKKNVTSRDNSRCPQTPWGPRVLDISFSGIC